MLTIRKIHQKLTDGEIFLHSMPGKNEELHDIMEELKSKKVLRIFCLTDKKEIEEKSPNYFDAVYYGHYESIYITYCPNPDFGIPTKEKDLKVYDKAIHQAFNTLKSGNILIHCQGGIGRTGTFATILMRKIGLPFDDALKLVHDAGSHPGNTEQINFVKNYQI
jgi:protein-tyrosine phosphatase